jgi:predicted dehydrogenase
VYAAGTIGGQWHADRPLTLITNNGKAVTPKLKGDGKWSAPFTAELQSAVDAVRDGKESPFLSGALARDALELCYAEAKSITSSKPVAVA